MWSWVILLGITVVVAAAMHRVLRKQPFMSGVLAGTGAALAFQVVARVQLGYFDPFWRVALFMTLPVTMPTAFAVVLALYYRDWRHSDSGVDKQGH